MLTGDVPNLVSGVEMSTLIRDDFETIPIPSGHTKWNSQARRKHILLPYYHDHVIQFNYNIFPFGISSLLMFYL